MIQALIVLALFICAFVLYAIGVVAAADAEGRGASVVAPLMSAATACLCIGIGWVLYLTFAALQGVLAWT